MLLLLACSEPEPPVEPTPEPVVEAAPSPTRYVSASVLKLREEADGKVIGRLAINSPVEVLEPGNDWVRVKVGNGTEGWVGAHFLVEEPLSAEQARSRAKAEPEERLSWLQRAAAIESDRTTLAALAAEYRVLGDDARAAIVEKQLGWPEDIRGVTDVWSVEDDGLIQVAWRPQDWETEEGRYGVLTASELAKEGLSIGQTWWVLPSGSAAFEARLKRAEWIVTNECAGTASITLFLDGAVPEGETALAAMPRTPPTSWNEALDAGLSREDAEAKAWKAAKTETGELSLVPTPGGWFARHAMEISSPEKDWYEAESRVLDLRLEGPRVEVVQEATKDSMDVQIVIGRRDLDGDGPPELILGGCSTAFVDADGNRLYETDWECCGC